ncbi:MAG: VWA domain-containing protein [Bacteroidales bacterium]|nr:VWA domain-containing protein [Candidatus Latescibacterota bacterium]
MKRSFVVLILFAGILSLIGCDTIGDFAAKFKKDKIPDDEITWSKGAPPLQRNLALVLDSSGSMKRNDKQKMMLFSSLVFIDMLSDMDQLYITSFPNPGVVSSDKLATDVINASCAGWKSSTADQIGPLRNDPSGNGELKDWVKSLEYYSQITVFEEPIYRAVKNLSSMEPVEAKRYLILFTDGNTDRGGKRTNSWMEEIHRREKENLLKYRDVLKKNNIVFYGVALGDATRIDHLLPLAEATGGTILKAGRPEDLVGKFAEVFGKILETRVEPCPLQGKTSVNINKYVKEFVLFIPDKGDQLSVSFEDPEGSKLSSQLGGSGYVRMDRTEHLGPYQIIHVNDPNPGSWDFKLEGLEDASALLIQNYDVYLQIYGKYPKRGLMNAPNLVRGRLVDSSGEPIKDPEFFSEGEFKYSLNYVETSLEDRPDERYGFEMEITPKDTLFHDLVCSAGNSMWLNRTINVKFGGKDGVILRVNNDADFGEVIPFADGMYYWWCRCVSKLLKLPYAENWRKNKAVVRFKGTDPALRGVVFKLDEEKLYDEYRIRLTDRRHRKRFVIDEDYKADFYLDINRDARKLGKRLVVPIIYPSNAGKIKGDKEIGVKAEIQELGWAWRTSHFWLQWLIYLWIFLFFIYRPLHYVFGYSTRKISYKPKRALRRYHSPRPGEGLLSSYLKALLFLYPLTMVKSFTNKRKGKKTQNKYLDSSFGSKLGRLIQSVLGFPTGPFARPFKAKVGNTNVGFFRSGGKILIRLGDLHRVTGKEAPSDKNKLVPVRGSISYPVPGEIEEGRFVIRLK